MNIEELTIGQVRELASLLNPAPATSSSHHPYKIGAIYFIRTVTYAVVGKLESVHPQELVLMDAAWIADTGRFASALKNEDFLEVEPFPEGRSVIVGRSGIIDAVEVTRLQRDQK